MAKDAKKMEKSVTTILVFYTNYVGCVDECVGF